MQLKYNQLCFSWSSSLTVSCYGFYSVLTPRLKVAVFSRLYHASMYLHTLHSQTCVPAVKHSESVFKKIKTTIFMNICIRQRVFPAQLCRHRRPPHATNSSHFLQDQLQRLCPGFLVQCIFIETLCNYCYYLRIELGVSQTHKGCRIHKADGVFIYLFQEPGAYEEIDNNRETRESTVFQNRAKDQTLRYTVGGLENVCHV